MNTQKYITSALIFFFFVSFSFAQTPKVKDELDGRIYTIQLLKDGKKAKPKEDEISFKGKFKSKIATEDGFSGAIYSLEIDSTVTPKVITFSSDLKSEKEQFIWEGRITGDSIEGTAYTTKKGNTIDTYTFTGTQKNKKK